MKSYTKALYLLVILICLFASMPFIGLLSYDPLQIYRKHAISGKSHFNNNMRQQAAGIINHYDFDSLILGTSMLKGSSSQQASKLLKGTFVNISADGSNIYERSLILKHALKKKENLKRVIFSYDTGLDNHSLKTSRRYPLKQFEPLYDSNLINDLSVYWNKHFLTCLITWSNKSACIGNKRELQRPVTWFTKTKASNAKISGVQGWLGEGGRGKAVSSRLNRHIKAKHSQDYSNNREKSWKQYTNQNLIPLIKNNPDVKFDIVLPPYSRFLTSVWQTWNKPKYNDYKLVVKQLVDHAGQFENLTIYGFDTLDYNSDLNNYRDMRHYNLDMNSYMLKAISENEHTLLRSNVDEYFDEFDQLNSLYDVNTVINALRQQYGSPRTLKQ